MLAASALMISAIMHAQTTNAPQATPAPTATPAKAAEAPKTAEPASAPAPASKPKTHHKKSVQPVGTPPPQSGDPMRVPKQTPVGK